MKRILMLMWMMAGFALFSHAQGDQSSNNRRLEKLKTDLALSDEQVAKFKESNKKFSEEQMRLRADTSLTRAELMEERKKIAEKREEEIATIFTKEQHEKWMSMKPSPNRQPRRDGRPQKSMEEMKKELGLNDKQVEELKAINKEMSEQFQQLRSDTTARQNKMTTMRGIMDERNAKIKKVLTKEQYTRFRELEQQRRRGRPGMRR